jgi:hypothetical protein
MKTPSEHKFGVRFQRELYEALIREQERLWRLRPGAGTSLSDLIREVSWRALLREEALHAERPARLGRGVIEEVAV